MHLSANDADARPFFFPSGEQQLFGLYHAPQSPDTRHTGIVLCYPTGHEYFRCHRGFRYLAARFAQAGYPVLRFDYSGSGDSSGESDTATLDSWSADVSVALAYMRARSRCAALCVIGLRLGANLALNAAAEASDLDHMIVWQPVIEGAAYLEEIRAQHVALANEFGTAGEAVHPPLRDAAPTEILGIPLSGTMCRQIAQIDLLALQERPARHVLLVDNTERGDDGRFRRQLESLTERCDYLHVSEPRFWQAEPYEAVMPHETVKAIIPWVVEALG